MEKLKKTARTLDRFAQTGQWICVIALLLILTVTGVIALAPRAREGMTGALSTVSVSFGTFSVNLAPGTVLEGRAFLWYLLSTVAASLVHDAFLFFGILILRSILRPMKEGKPFDTAVSVNLRKLGVLIFIGGVSAYVLKTGLSSLFYRAFDVGTILNPETVTGYKMVYSFDLMWLIAGLLVFLLSYVFKYGEELQKQSDETL